MKNGLLKNGAPEIILTGQMGVPDELIRQLESSGNTVYPFRDIRKAIASGIADGIAPSAMINMAHGRIGDMAVEYLERKNIPLFAPLNVNRDYGEWREKINRHSPSEDDGRSQNRGKRVGVAYELENGDIIYVPE